MTRVILWAWFVGGACSFLITLFSPAHEDRAFVLLAFAGLAAIGGSGLWLWRYIDELRRRLRGREQA